MIPKGGGSRKERTGNMGILKEGSRAAVWAFDRQLLAAKLRVDVDVTYK